MHIERAEDAVQHSKRTYRIGARPATWSNHSLTDISQIVVTYNLDSYRTDKNVVNVSYVVKIKTFQTYNRDFRNTFGHWRSLNNTRVKNFVFNEIEN